MNYLAILACVVMHALLGGLWYSGIFASTWMSLNNISPTATMSAGALPYLYSIFMSLMMALLMTWLLGRLKMTTAMEGARLGLILGFCTILVAFATNYRFSGRPETLALIDGMYPVISLVIMGAILGGWRKKA